MRQIENRLRRLERQPENAARRLKQVILWDDGRGSAQIEAAALEKEHGENIEIVLVGWLPDASATYDARQIVRRWPRQSASSAVGK